ncbi:MAG: hypothetical protein JNM72_17410 [Deltaproteobacteria bacterium]|nr:hypothetical protein [Deltaproteobacteria bacterium]
MQLRGPILGLSDPPPPRRVDACYEDPLSLVWRSCAEALGWRVERSAEVYASWDGRGTLRISDDAGMDADDSVAQLILHEICHALVEAPGGLLLPDWGLENVDSRHLVREFACHRLQAALADRVGLRRFFAPTTDWRPHYDALGADPLAADPLDDLGAEAARLARAALARARDPPWAAPLGSALTRTARIVAVVREIAPPDSTFAAPAAAAAPPLAGVAGGHIGAD